MKAEEVWKRLHSVLGPPDQTAGNRTRQLNELARIVSEQAETMETIQHHWALHLDKVLGVASRFEIRLDITLTPLRNQIERLEASWAKAYELLGAMQKGIETLEADAGHASGDANEYAIVISRHLDRLGARIEELELRAGIKRVIPKGEMTTLADVLRKVGREPDPGTTEA